MENYIFFESVKKIEKFYGENFLARFQVHFLCRKLGTGSDRKWPHSIPCQNICPVQAKRTKIGSYRPFSIMNRIKGTRGHQRSKVLGPGLFLICSVRALLIFFLAVNHRSICSSFVLLENDISFFTFLNRTKLEHMADS